MLKQLDNAKFGRLIWLSPFIMVLGVYGGTTSALPLPWIWLVVCGSAALYLQFGGTEVLKGSMQRMKKGSWKIVPLAIVISFVCSYAALFLGQLLGFGSVENANAFADGSIMSRLIHLAELTFSLVGEELITASFAFPVYVFLKDKVEKPMHAWIAASIISSLLFGMMHVNVYHWNMWQCLVAIGLTRLPFNWAWRKTDSLWGGIWAHIIYDLIIFVPAIFFF